MDEELQEKLFNEFPELYRGRHESIEKNLMSFGFNVGNGWYDIIYELSEKITDFCEENDIKIPKVFQVKEKFAGLRYYLEECPHNQIRDFIKEAEKRAQETCEVCGEKGKIRDGSWLKTLCDKHAAEQGYTEELPEEMVKSLTGENIEEIADQSNE